ncbi:methionyl-tRNA formyltransferase [Thermophagus xiamenensis]|uniref:Methionyl-tRNA formyltransferase n=1 Tax=Thermophagus xiamenensis TaxID=385682 RepID=A0A1I1VFW8_9BACT|nr:methionyl-tRNA formyltransferase [Thermophagus xiamenensis]SFD81769.1 methionyl-tRNA formyltransferase [Thermophagus xiamenensis]
MQDLKIVFMGTPNFAVESLKALLEAQMNIVGVITSPDKPAGRGRKLTSSPVKNFATEKGLKILQPTNLKDPRFLEELKDLKADLQVVVAFRMLPEVVWNMPPLGTFNLHASLLPDYRGAAPINWAIINGEEKTGVTTFFLQHEIDTGDILFQEETPILPEDNAGSLHDKLMVQGANMVVKTVKAIANQTITPQPQAHKQGKPAPKIFKEDCKIDWYRECDTVHNKIRGLSPYPAAWTELSYPNEERKQSIKIFRTEKSGSAGLNPGEIYCDQKKIILVGTRNGDLKIKELQMAGKKRMTTEEFLKGNKIPEGASFGS